MNSDRRLTLGNFHNSSVPKEPLSQERAMTLGRSGALGLGHVTFEGTKKKCDLLI